MFASKYLTLKPSLIAFVGMLVVLFANFANAGTTTRNAVLGQTTSIILTSELVGLGANLQPDGGYRVTFDNITCDDDRLSLSEEFAAKELTGSTETDTSCIQSTKTLSYKPSSEAAVGDTYSLPYTATANDDGQSPSVIGSIEFTIVQSTQAADVLKGICETAEEEAQQNQEIGRTANRTLDPEELLQLCADADFATINPEEVVAQFTSVKQQITAQKGNIFKRFKALRAGDTGVSVAGLTYSIKGDEFSGEWLHAIADSIGGAAGEGAPVSKWGFFVNGSLTDGDRDGTDLERGYDNDASTATIGADYRFSRNLIGGIAYGINESSLEFDGNDDGMDNDMTNVIVYGTWYKEAFNVDVLIGASEGEIKTKRQVTVGSDSHSIGGKTDTQQTFFSIASGYNFNKNALSYGPYASFDYITGEIDAYEESGTVGLEVSFDEQDIDSKVFTMGGQVSYAISTNWGVVVPHARAEWKKELDDDRDIITGQFTGIAGSTFSIEADDFDDNWFHAAVGVSATFRHGLSAYIDYDSIVAYDDTSLSTLSYGGRWEASF